MAYSNNQQIDAIMYNEEILTAIQALPLKERKRLIYDALESVRREEKTRQERYGELATIMEDIIGETIQFQDRHKIHVWARTMIAYQMKSEGFTSHWIGTHIHKDHSSVLYMAGKMRDVLKYPNQYRDIMPMWNEFQKRINDETYN